MNIKESINKMLEENGIELDEQGVLTNVDSISFISTIVSIEQEFDIEFPDEYLLLSSLSSINDIVRVVETVINQKVG